MDSSETGTPAPSSSTPTTSISPTGLGPLVTIVSPLTNSVNAPGSLTVSIVVSNFDIANMIGQPDVAGEGHVIYYLDVANPPITPGKSALTACWYLCRSGRYILYLAKRNARITYSFRSIGK